MNKSAVLIGVMLVTSVVSKSQVVTIDAAKTKQYIDGFGACTAWSGRISETEANVAFGNDNNSQLGLSILRVRIDPALSWADEKVNAQKAKTRGALILASPWTPPASMKTNSSIIAGELKTSSYADYASYLKRFCDTMGNVDVISIQNEPNINVTYESCKWNATQLLNFCKNNAPAIGKPVLMPEASDFGTQLSDSTLNDTTAASNISFIGGHLYGPIPFNYANAINKGKRVWMTEHYYNNDDIGTCTEIAKEITDCFYNNMSAYIWWYLIQPGCNLINASGAIKKKGYAIAQFSKFIRPGYYRVDATYHPQIGVYVTAYKGADDVMVVLNLSKTSKNQTFTFKNDSVIRVMKYTTSAVKSIAYEGTIDLTDSSFTSTLDSSSITTFVSTKATGCAQTPIIPYFKVNDGIMKDSNKITCILGDSVILAPQAGNNNLWKWNGCGISGTNSRQTIYPDGTCTSAIITYTNSCGASTSLQYAITVKSNVDVISSSLNSEVKIFPNPVISGTFNLRVPDSYVGYKINIFNLIGEQVYNNTLSGNEMSIHSGLIPGVYILRIVGNNSFCSEKLLLK